MSHGATISWRTVRATVLMIVYRITTEYLHPVLIFTSKMTKSSLGPNVKNFVEELSEATLTATLKKSEHRSAHPKRALLTRSTGIILLGVVKFAKPKKRVP